MKREAHPMQAKKDLASRIVGDFHSGEAAAKAEEDWAKQFQKQGIPSELESVDIKLSDVAVDGTGKEGGAFLVISRSKSKHQTVRIDKLIRFAGLAASNSEAATKLKGGAVAIDGESVGETNLIADMPLGHYSVLRVGRRMKRIRVVDKSHGS